MLPIALLSFEAAAYLWVAIMLACAFALGYLALFLARLPVRGSIIPWLVGAGVLVFYPVKIDLALGQSDDLSALLALAAIALGTLRPLLSGALALLALLVKPQTVALSMAALLVKRPRMLIGVLLAGVATAIVLFLLTKTGHSPGTLFDWYQAVRGTRTTPSVTLVALRLLLAVAAGAWIVAHWRGKEVDLVVLCGVAAAFNVILGSLIYLRTDSVTLLILPLLLVLKPWLSKSPPAWVAVILGIICGLLSGDALFAISYYAGSSHAILPWVTAAMFGLGAVFLKPSLRWVGLAGVVTNLAVSFPALPPSAAAELATIAAFGLLLLMGTYGMAPHSGD